MRKFRVYFILKSLKTKDKSTIRICLESLLLVDMITIEPTLHIMYNGGLIGYTYKDGFNEYTYDQIWHILPVGIELLERVSDEGMLIIDTYALDMHEENALYDSKEDK